jgi:type I restriction enzyme, S subunit
MKTGWQTKTLGDVCGFVRGPFGGSLKKSVFVEDGFAVYEQQHAIYDQFDDVRYFIDEAKFKEMKRFEIFPNDLIMSCSGTMGKVAIVPNNIRRGIINQALLKLTPASSILPKFLKYWMDSIGFQESLKEQSMGAAIQNVASVRVLKEIKTPLPPLPDQQRIVGILDEAFDGIATAKANAEKNLQNARAIFESYLQSVFTLRGEGWLDKRLEQIGTTQTGSTPKAAERGNYGDFIPFVKPGDFNKDGSLDYNKDGLSEKGLDEARKVAAGSVLMVCIGATIGKCGYCDRDVTTNQQINALTPSNGVSHKFVYYQMLTESFQRSVMNSSAQATLPIINKSKWNALTVVLPPKLEEQKRIVAKFDALASETLRLSTLYERKLAALEALKKSLLHQAFNGKL